MTARFDWVIEVLLVVLLVFGPLAFGVVHAWSEQVVIVLAALISLVFLLKLSLFADCTFVWSWTYVPIALFILVAVLQLIHLPSAIVNILSPNTVALRKDLLGDLPNAREILSSMTLSFYPHMTRHDLRLLLAVAAVFVVVVNVYRRPDRVKRLLATISLIGGAIALLAMVQDVAGNGKIYWLVPTHDEAHSATFVNHSHFGQFMNLSIGAALGLLLVSLHEAFVGRRVTPADVRDYLHSSASNTPKVLAAVIVIGAATVFVSLTRGGMISTLIAACFTAAVLSRRRSLRGPGWILVLLAMGVFVCVLWVGFDQVYDRLASLRELHRAQNGRWQILASLVSVWTQFPLFGTGLGTHEMVYPMFDHRLIAELVTHAENEYAQFAEETGLVGFSALALLVVGIWVSYSKAIKTGLMPICSAAYGLGFGVLAILIHSFSDFGQHLPANAMLSAVCGGLLVALPHLNREDTNRSVSCERRVAVNPYWSVVLLATVCVWTWGIVGADRARVGQAHWNRVLAAEAHLKATEWLASQEAYGYLFAHAKAAARAEPDDIHYQYWLGAYEWLSLTPYADPNTQELPPQAEPWVRQIVRELHQARPLCPTFGPLHCLIGEIEQFVLGDPNGAERIRKGYRLAPNDATVCFAAARIDAQQGRTDDAFGEVVRAVQLDPDHFQRAARLCVNELNRGDLALRLAGEDTWRLAYVGTLLAPLGEASELPALAADRPLSSSDQQQLAEQARMQVFAQLKRRCEEPNAPASAHASLADLYRQRNELEAAIQHYYRAVRLDYDQVAWHCALAQSLAKVNRTDEAMHEAAICLRLRPDCSPAKDLMKVLSAYPAAPARAAVTGS